MRKEQHEATRGTISRCRRDGSVGYRRVRISNGSSSSDERRLSASGGSSAGTINIYSDLPLKGAVSAQTLPALNGEKLALSQAGNKAGQWKVNFISLDDSTATSPTNYDLRVCQANARKAATDPKAVYMVGPFNSGCAKVEIPITNQAGLAQVSPANTLPGLTTNDPGSSPGEPQIYYPTQKRTYLRIVPRDTSRASGPRDDEAVRVHPRGGGRRQDAVRRRTGTQIQLNQKKYGITVTGLTPLDPTSPNFRSYASTVKSQGADCVYTAFNPPGEVELVKDINAAIPTAKIFGGDGVCSGRETNPRRAASREHRAAVPLHGATRGLTTYPGGKAFLAAYK